MDLQPLFREKIIHVEELSPGYEDHASDVWLVRTEGSEVIVRASRFVNEADGVFRGGCRAVFGINPRNVHALETVNNTLNGISRISIPKVLGKGYIDREYVIVEKLNGTMLTSFIGQADGLLYSLGAGLAQIHRKTLNYAGNPSGTLRIEPVDFHEHVVRAMGEIVKGYYGDNAKIRSALPHMSNRMRSLPAPQNTSFVLVDLDPTQFLTDGSTVTGLVDTEAYAVGPRELDFIALEYVLDSDGAKEFTAGYRTVLELPDLSRCRIPYRYLYRLLEIQGQEDLDRWLAYPQLF